MNSKCGLGFLIPAHRGTPDASSPFGISLLRDPTLNKGTAFTEKRGKHWVRGLLPPRVHAQEEQIQRVLGNFHRKPSDLERYIFMIALQDRNETLFYRVVLDHLEEIMTIIEDNDCNCYDLLRKGSVIKPLKHRVPIECVRQIVTFQYISR